MADVLSRLEQALDRTETRRVAGRIRSISGLMFALKCRWCAWENSVSYGSRERASLALLKLSALRTTLYCFRCMAIQSAFHCGPKYSDRATTTVTVGDFMIGAIIDAHGHVIRKQ